MTNSKRTRKWPWFLGGTVLVIVIVAAMSSGGSAPSPDGGSPVPAADGDTAEITYQVEGPAQALNVTYSADGSGSIAQENAVALPWSKTVAVKRGFSIPVLSAQNAGTGDITCRVLVDGQIVKEITSSGEYALASCTGDPIT